MEQRGRSREKKPRSVVDKLAKNLDIVKLLNLAIPSRLLDV